MAGLYDLTVPIFTRALNNLDHIIGKAAASGIGEEQLMAARLAPDMLPFPKQVQIACDTAKLAVTRIAQVEPRPMADEETSLAELRERIARTVAYLAEAAPPLSMVARRRRSCCSSPISSVGSRALAW